MSILTEYKQKTIKKEIKEVVGLDFVMNGLFGESEQGEIANYPGFHRQALVKLAKEQRALSQKTKDSNRWNRQRIKVAKLHEKVWKLNNTKSRKTTG